MCHWCSWCGTIRPLEDARSARRAMLWKLILGPTVAFLVVVLATFAHAAEPLGPDPALSPEDVVQIQLEALQRNDIPTQDAGIRQAWMLAHPDNRRVTGPLPRFERMIKGAAYRPLIGHAAHDIERLGTTEEQVTFKVTIQTPEWRRPGISLGSWPGQRRSGQGCMDDHRRFPTSTSRPGYLTPRPRSLATIFQNRSHTALSQSPRRSWHTPLHDPRNYGSNPHSCGSANSIEFPAGSRT